MAKEKKHAQAMADFRKKDAAYVRAQRAEEEAIEALEEARRAYKKAIERRILAELAYNDADVAEKDARYCIYDKAAEYSSV